MLQESFFGNFSFTIIIEQNMEDALGNFLLKPLMETNGVFHRT